MKNRHLFKVCVCSFFIGLTILLSSGCQKKEADIDEYTYRRTTASALTTTASATRANLIYDASFDQSNLLTNLSGLSTQTCCSYSAKQTTAYVNSGTSAMRFELNKTDPDVAGSKRAEWKRPVESSATIERWYGISYYFPSDFTKDQAHDVIIQWHQSASSGSPPLSMRIKNDQFTITQTTGGQKFVNTALGTVPKGKWVDIVWHIKFSTGSSGLVEVWIDGVKKYTKTGVNNFDKNYLKFGIYKSHWKSDPSYSTTSKRVLYIDNLRIGNEKATYEDVAP